MNNKDKVQHYTTHPFNPDFIWIETASGGMFNLLPPKPEQINIEDVAGALARNCRYNGQISKMEFYSVAEHSVIMSEWAEAQGHGRQDQLDFLLHDAAEAYICDMPTPWKRAMPEYKKIEKQVEAVVIPALGGIFPTAAFIKEADTRIVLDERAQLMSGKGPKWAIDDLGLEPLGVEIKGWLPHRARFEFEARFHRLHHMILKYGG